MGDGSSICGVRQRSGVRGMGQGSGIRCVSQVGGVCVMSQRSGVSGVGKRSGVCGYWGSDGSMGQGSGMSDEGRVFADDCVESGVSISSVVDSAAGAVGFQEGVLSLNVVSQTSLVLALEVAGVRVSDVVRETGVVGSQTTTLGRDYQQSEYGELNKTIYLLVNYSQRRNIFPVQDTLHVLSKSLNDD